MFIVPPQPSAPVLGTSTTLFRLTGANFNTTADQAFVPVMAFSKFIIQSIMITEASGALLGAIGGIYSAPSKGGVAIVSAAQAYGAITASDSVLSLSLTAGGTKLMTAQPPYLSLTTPLGIPATANIFMMGVAS